MNKRSIPSGLTLLFAVGGLSVLLVGCGKRGSETPTGGYSGGQKSGAVNNGPSSSGGPSRGGYSQPGAVNNGPSSAGSPGR